MLGTGSSLFGKPSTPTTQPPPFGATSTPSLFGASSPAPNLTFGAGATSTPLGAQASSTPFGAPATSTPFGAPATSTPFGAAATSTPFGAAATSTPFGAAATPLAAPTTASQPAGLNFGFGTQAGFKAPATTTQSTLFGNLGAKTTAAPTLNFGLGSNANKGFALPTTTAAPTTSAPLTFGFGSTATTTAPTLNFGLGSSTTSSQLSFGIGLTTTTASSGFGVQTTQSFGLNAAASTANVGLGAVTQTTSTSSGLNPLSSLPPSTSKPEKVETSKDRPVPPELISQVESLREYVKQQKSHSSEVSLASLKPISKVKEDAEILNRMIVKLERDLVKNRVSDKKLRADLTRSIQDCEIVQRLSANQRGFPCDDSIAIEYFQNIISRFQAQAETLLSEFKEMERHVSCRINPVPFTPEELGISMKRLYECFVALAGRYQTIHSNITALKQEVKRLQKKVES